LDEVHDFIAKGIFVDHEPDFEREFSEEWTW
jgi:hypothetical protein